MNSSLAFPRSLILLLIYLLSQPSVVSAICTIPVVCSQPYALSVVAIVAVVAVELRPHVTDRLGGRLVRLQEVQEYDRVRCHGRRQECYHGYHHQRYSLYHR